MVGADTNDFFPAIEDATKGIELSKAWSVTARRLNSDFKTSVGFINGKRCLGGFLELMVHCHYLVAEENANLGMPEVTLPVIPGMEGCHWPLRKMKSENYKDFMKFILSGKTVKAKDSVGWLVDYAGTMEDSIKMAMKIAKWKSQNDSRSFGTNGDCTPFFRFFTSSNFHFSLCIFH